MPSSLLPYDTWIEEALRGVVRKALTHAVVHGLVTPHHFYITFATDAPALDMPDWLRAQYPEAMTIVLQHQFWDLQVYEDAFSVSLRFHGRPALLHIPFSAIQAFSDPGVNFGLQLHALPGQLPEADASETTGETSGGAAPALTAPEPQGEVIALDSFRKK